VCAPWRGLKDEARALARITVTALFGKNAPGRFKSAVRRLSFAGIRS
jgi:hypothetical protein